MSDKTGADDFIAAGGDLDGLIASASPHLPPAPDDGVGGPGLAAQLVKLAQKDGVDLFHDASGISWMTVSDKGFPDTFELPSAGASLWLRKQAHFKLKKTPSGQAVNDAMSQLEAIASFDGVEAPVFIRTAYVAGAVYIDLCDAKGTVFQVDSSGWMETGNAPVRFHRPADSRALPYPKRGGDLRDLGRFVNVENYDDFKLLVTLAASYFYPPGPYAIMVLSGEAGSAKSTTARVVRALTDPGNPELAAPPRDEDALVAASLHRLVITADNVSSITPEMSDAYCRLATAGGTQKRSLYSNNDVASAQVKNPIIITAIGNVVSRGDLNSRAVTFELPHIPRRLTEDAFWAAFAALAPGFLGIVLNTLAGALKRLASVPTDLDLPRMADFAKFGYAAAPALDWTGDEFLRVLKSHRIISERAIAEDHPLVQVLILFMKNRKADWLGTASELLEALDRYSVMFTPRTRPSGPNRLGDMLKRVGPMMAPLGLEVTKIKGPRPKQERMISIKIVPVPDDEPPPSTADEDDFKIPPYGDEEDDLPEVQDAAVDSLGRLPRFMGDTGEPPEALTAEGERAPFHVGGVAEIGEDDGDDGDDGDDRPAAAGPEYPCRCKGCTYCKGSAQNAHRLYSLPRTDREDGICRYCLLRPAVH